MTITLPDICAGLESDDGTTSSSKFKAWYRDNLEEHIPLLTDSDAYSLRCGIVHQGRLGHPKLQYDRLVFFLPGPVRLKKGAIHQISTNPDVSSCSYSVEAFCDEIVAAVRRWYELKKADPNVLANLPRLVRLHPDGLAPYAKGLAVIA
jgi:hypothetical protein